MGKMRRQKKSINLMIKKIKKGSDVFEQNQDPFIMEVSLLLIEQGYGFLH